VYADIKKKHSSHAITGDVSVAETAAAAQFFNADGVIITGSTTGKYNLDILAKKLIVDIT
jgi:predicted TIM-barrel enzyme